MIGLSNWGLLIKIRSDYFKHTLVCLLLMVINNYYLFSIMCIYSLQQKTFSNKATFQANQLTTKLCLHLKANLAGTWHYCSEVSKQFHIHTILNKWKQITVWKFCASLAALLIAYSVFLARKWNKKLQWKQGKTRNANLYHGPYKM